ncbi:hypothetical protein ACFLRW_05400 [Acidobacteriota bacterium]
MKKKMCPMEKEITAGLMEKKLKPELQKHASDCPVCKDVLAVHTWMNKFKEKSWKTDMLKKDLPDAEAVGKRGYSRKKPDEQMVKKALKPLIYPKVVSLGVFLAAIIFLSFKGILNFRNIFDNPVLIRIFPFFLVLLSMVFLSVIFCTLLLALEKRKKIF